jgi:hypothetical protein
MKRISVGYNYKQLKTNIIMKTVIIRMFGLKGSWKWAKKQMLQGKIVRCKHWSGSLKLKIESKDNPLLQANFTRTPKTIHESDKLWETSNWHISYEDYTDYEVFEW